MTDQFSCGSAGQREQEYKWLIGGSGCSIWEEKRGNLIKSCILPRKKGLWECAFIFKGLFKDLCSSVESFKCYMPLVQSVLNISSEGSAEERITVALSTWQSILSTSGCLLIWREAAYAINGCKHLACCFCAAFQIWKAVLCFFSPLPLTPSSAAAQSSCRGKWLHSLILVFLFHSLSIWSEAGKYSQDWHL